MDKEIHDANSVKWVSIPVMDNEYPSLSDNHDYEPGLEFDDSEILNSSRDLALFPSDVLPETISLDKHCEYAETPVSDGTIEENFEEELAGAPQVYPQVSDETDSIHEQDFHIDREIFAQLDCNGLIEVVGDDAVGRRIIVVSACRLPSSQDLHQDKLLRYMMFTLNKYVEQDYSVVYFHYGLCSKNKPSFSWLWKAYKTFDRKYKKNLKALYLVHPTNFIRIVWKMLKPAISVKFGKKMMYVNYLHELRQYLDIDKICIPDEVKKHDEALLANKRNSGIMSIGSKSPTTTIPENQITQPLKDVPPTQQFGVSLQFIKENNVHMIDSIPPIVRQCVEFLSQPDALETEGLFRRSTSVNLIKEYQSQCDAGSDLRFENPHIPAVLLKAFLRELEEPLMTFELYDEIIQFQTWSKEDKPRKVKILILEKLPIDNYKLLKYIMQFLWKVMDRSDLNKMTSSNLSVVFGPNLVWPPNGQMSLQAIAPINSFTDFILQNQESIFII